MQTKNGIIVSLPAWKTILLKKLALMLNLMHAKEEHAYFSNFNAHFIVSEDELIRAVGKEAFKAIFIECLNKMQGVLVQEFDDIKKKIGEL